MTEDKVIQTLESYILKNHKLGGDVFEKLCPDYDFVSAEFEGPSIDDDTGEPDDNCIMYLINIDSHLSDRLTLEDKYSISQEYDTLYGWIFLDSKTVDIVGLDNYEDGERANIISNLDAFFSHIKSKA